MNPTVLAIAVMLILLVITPCTLAYILHKMDMWELEKERTKTRNLATWIKGNRP